MAHAARHPTWHVRVPTAPILSWLARAASIVAGWQERARDRQALSRLNDHYLRDIGLTRDQVMLENAKPFWRP